MYPTFAKAETFQIFLGLLIPFPLGAGTFFPVSFFFPVLFILLFISKQYTLSPFIWFPFLYILLNLQSDNSFVLISFNSTTIS